MFISLIQNTCRNVTSKNNICNNTLSIIQSIGLKYETSISHNLQFTEKAFFYTFVRNKSDCWFLSFQFL